MRRSPLVQTHATLPEYFAQHGYTTLNRGKLLASVRELITTQRLTALYGVPVDIVTHIEDGRSRRLCVPRVEETSEGGKTSCALS